MFDRNAKLELTCPECGTKWSERLGDLRQGPVNCPSCHVQLETAEFDKGMGEAERALKRFGRSLR